MNPIAKPPNVAAELERAQREAPEWYVAFEDAHLCVQASARAEDVAELVATAPGGERGFLAGFVTGLYINN
jgi:hypothetical protein